MAKGGQSDVLVRMTAQEAAVVQGFRNLTTAQRATERQTRQVNRSTRQMGRSVDRLGNQARNLGRILGFGALAGVARQLGRAFDEQNRKAREFEGGLRGLIAVGDNVGRIGELREEVRDMMVQWGVSGEQAVNVMSTLDDRAGALESRFQRGLEPAVMRFSRLMNLDANQTMNTSISLMNVFGDELESTAQLLDLLKMTADAGAVGVEDLGGRVREMAPALEGMGLSLREFLAAIATASERGMEANTVTRGMEALVGAMADMRREGELTGDTLPAMLTELTQRGEDLDEILPRAATRVASALMDGANVSGDLIRNLEDLENVDGLRFQRQEAERLTDSMQQLLDFGERTEQIGEAAPMRVPAGARHFGALTDRARATFTDAMDQIGLGFMSRMGIMGVELRDLIGPVDTLIGSPLARAGTEHDIARRMLGGQAPRPEDFADIAMLGGGAPHPVERGHYALGLGERREQAAGVFEREAGRLGDEQERRGEEREQARLQAQQLEESRRQTELMQQQHQMYLQWWQSLTPGQRAAQSGPSSMSISRGRRNAHED